MGAAGHPNCVRELMQCGAKAGEKEEKKKWMFPPSSLSLSPFLTGRGRVFNYLILRWPPPVQNGPFVGVFSVAKVLPGRNYENLDDCR